MLLELRDVSPGMVSEGKEVARVRLDGNALTRVTFTDGTHFTASEYHLITID